MSSASASNAPIQTSSVTAKTPFEQTALQKAIIEGNEEGIKILLENGTTIGDNDYYLSLETWGKSHPITSRIATAWKKQFKLAFLCDKLGYDQHKGECWIDTVQEIFFFTDGLKEITQPLFYTMTDEMIERYVDAAIARNIIQGGSYTVKPQILAESLPLLEGYEHRLLKLMLKFNTSDKVVRAIGNAHIGTFELIHIFDNTIFEYYNIYLTPEQINEFKLIRDHIRSIYSSFTINRRSEYIRGIRSMRNRFITHYDFLMYNKEILTCEHPNDTKRMYIAMTHKAAMLKRTQSAQLSPNLAKALSANYRRQSQTSETDYNSGDSGARIFPILLKMFYIPFRCNLNPSRHTGIAYGVDLGHIDGDRGMWNTPTIIIKKVNSRDNIWSSSGHAVGILKCNNIWYYYDDNFGVSYVEESLISAIFISQPKNIFKALYYNFDIQKLFLYLFEDSVPKKLEDNSWEQTIRMTSVWRDTQFVDIKGEDITQFYKYDDGVLNKQFLKGFLYFILPRRNYSIEPTLISCEPSISSLSSLIPVSTLANITIGGRRRHRRSGHNRSTRRRRSTHRRRSTRRRR